MNPQKLCLLASLALLALTTSSEAAGSSRPSALKPSAQTPQEAPPSPVRSIRFKLSAGDLLSAESILERYLQSHGEDTQWLEGLAWLARGAVLLNEPDKAGAWAETVRGRVHQLLQTQNLLDDRNVESALGAAIEVEAQLLERTSKKQAAAYLEERIAELWPAGKKDSAGQTRPSALVSRLYKRLNLITLKGQTAPEIQIEDFVGQPPPKLSDLRGKPVVLFVWAEWCGDCKSQAALLARAKRLYQSKGLNLVTITRYYESNEEKGARATEKLRVQEVWQDSYEDVGTVPMILSTESMERYGGSSTPTYVFIDPRGTVTEYTATRLTEEEFDLRVREIL